MNSVLSMTFMSDDDFGADVGLKSNFHKKHTLALLWSLDTVKLLSSGHLQDRVKVPLLGANCPLYKLGLRCFGHLLLKAIPIIVTTAIYALFAKKVIFNF